jgi:RNA 3'-phosphate cyclase
MIEYDGSFGEGGGQVIRSSLALSLITGKPFHLYNLRANRKKPGLQPQHLASVRAAAAIGQAETRGAALNSQDLVFEPGPVQAGQYDVRIQTAGALSLAFHTVYLPLALRTDQPSELRLTGGTHVRASPSFQFLDSTWRGYLSLLGLGIDLRLDRLGFYPKGGGSVWAQVQPCARLQGLQLEDCGSPRRIRGTSAVAGLPEHIAQRMASRATERLRDQGLEADIHLETWQGGPGAVLNLIIETTPVPTLITALGERRKPAEKVADEGVERVLEYLEGPAPLGIEAHTADQLVLPLVLAEGPSSMRVSLITRHLLTNIAVIRKFVDREIACDAREGEAGCVRVH